VALVEVSIIPLGTGTASVSQYVAQAVGVLKGKNDIKYEMTAMGTIIEGDLERILSLVREMHGAVFGAGVVRVVTTVTIDERRDKASTAASKVGSLKTKLGG